MVLYGMMVWYGVSHYLEGEMTSYCNASNPADAGNVTQNGFYRTPGQWVDVTSAGLILEDTINI